MADHMYKLSEIPKKQRLAHFWEYYKVPAAIVIVVAIIVISMIKLMFFRTKPDVSVIFASSRFLATETQEKFEAELNAVAFDYNSDNKVTVDFNPNTLDEENDIDVQQYAAARNKLYAALMTDAYIIQIVDEDMYNLIKGEGVMGTYAEFEGYDTGKPTDEFVKIPLKDIEAFKESASLLPHDYYITIRNRVSARVEGSEKKIQNYENHIDMVAKMAGFEKK